MISNDDTYKLIFDNAVEEGLWSAAALLRFAGEVLHDGACYWVVLRAIDTAEKNLRDAVDGGDDMNVVDARLSTLRLRLGISGIRDLLMAGGMADFAIDGAEQGAAKAKACEALEQAAKTCYSIAFAK